MLDLAARGVDVSEDQVRAELTEDAARPVDISRRVLTPTDLQAVSSL